MGPRRLVGRREQLARLDEAVRVADAGEPQFVVFGGESGMGKTRLMEHVAQRLESGGARVLRTRCVELGTQGLPLAPLTAALRQLVGLLGAEALSRTVFGADALVRLLPEYAEGEPAEHDLARLFELFGGLLHRLGEAHPLLWVVDDLHWSDRSTRDLIGYLARTLTGSRILVTAAYRDDHTEPHHPLRPFLAELERLPGVRRTDLGPLSSAETAELVRGVLARRPGPELVDAVHRRCGGNPFFAEELARAGGGPGLPGSLRDLLLHGIRELSPPARRVVAHAAAAGQVVGHRLLAAATGLAEADLLDALRHVVDARILVPDGTGYAFRHALLRDAVLDDLLPAETARLHRVLATALDDDPGLTTAERYDAEIAVHWHRAGEAARAFPALLRAAETATRIHAYAEQARMLAHAVDLWSTVPDPGRAAGTDRLGLFETAIAPAVWAGEYFLALDLTDRALEAADPAVQPARAAMLHAHRAMALHNLDRDGALTSVDEAAALLPAGRCPERARGLDYLAAVLTLRGHPARARALAEEAVAIAAELDEPELAVQTRNSLGWALAELGAFGEGFAVLDATRQLPASTPDTIQYVRLCLNLAVCQHGRGEFAAAIAAARDGLASRRLSGLQRSMGVALRLCLALSLHAVGEWDEAAAQAVHALELDSSTTQAGAFLALLAEIHLARGDVDAARDALSQAHTGARGPARATPWTLPVVRLRAELALHDNRVDDALSSVADGLGVATGAPLQRWALLTTAVRTEERAPSRAGSTVDRLSALAAGLPSDTPLLAAYAAQFEAEVGNRPWAQAVAAWDGVGHAYHGAQARLRAAEQSLAAGSRDAARDWLSDAAARAIRLQATPMLEQVRLLSRSARLRVDTGQAPADEVDALDRMGLTERETEVLRFVASGQSNREIAERLFISVKTVSVHVSNILAKMGAANRGEATAIAYRLRLFPER